MGGRFFMLFLLQPNYGLSCLTDVPILCIFCPTAYDLGAEHRVVLFIRNQWVGRQGIGISH